MAAVAAHQEGAFSREQAHRAGWSNDQLRRREASGELRRTGDRSWAFAAAPLTWRQGLWSVVLDLGPGTRVSHRAAAALHPLDGFGEDVIEVTIPAGRRVQPRPGVTVHLSTYLDRIDRVTIEGLPATSATRTIIDLAAVCSAKQLEVALDAGVRDLLTTEAFLYRRLAQLDLGHRRGSATLRELLSDGIRCHSELERAFAQLVRRAGLPRPVPQQVFRHDGRFVARVDFSFPNGLVVEVHGRKPHATGHQQQRDLERTNELSLVGEAVLQFTTSDVYERPDYVLATVARGLDRAA